MQRQFGSSLTVVKIPKSGGVVELDPPYRERVHSYQLHAYMYGQVFPIPAGLTAANTSLGGEVPSEDLLAPSSTTISFDDLSIYRIGAESMAPSSALPIGAARVLSELQALKIDPSQPGSGLMNSLLALLAPFHPDENERYDEEILDLPVVGYLVVCVSSASSLVSPV
jgi:polyribonucleotide 5'-hydroxyl-kinase